MEQKRLIIALALSFGIIFAWDKFYMAPRRPKTDVALSQATQTPVAVTQSGSGAGPSVLTPEKATGPIVRQEIKTSIGSVTLTNEAPLFADWKLNEYAVRPGEQLSLNDVLLRPSAGELAFDTPELAYLSRVRGRLANQNGIWVWTYQDANVRVVRSYFSSATEAAVRLKIEASFPGAVKPKFMFVGLTSATADGDSEAQDRRFGYWTEDALKTTAVEKSISLREVPGSIHWLVAESRYFVFGWVNATAGKEARGLIQPTLPFQGRMSLVFPVTGDSAAAELKAFLSPKRLEVLKAIDPTLDHAVDFGWLTVFAHPLLSLMKWIQKGVSNWGIAIILLTLLVKLATFPLTYKSMKSMKHMAAMQPELQKLKDKYKDDKDALNREMMTMMRSKGYNPVAGCLPILVQMPVFFALYRVLYSSIELYQAPFYGWIHDLSAKDPFYVMPVMVTATMFFQQKLQPNTATDPMQQKMLQWMPVIFGAFMLTMPSGLAIYMFVNTLAGIVQQLAMNRAFGTGPSGKLAKIGA